ncbi:hypothetical protein [Clostridium sp. CM027]|nr:hypothetical protein [Clostridium sp. CM027]
MVKGNLFMVKAKIGNVVGWLIDAIKKDYKPAKGKVKSSPAELKY